MNSIILETKQNRTWCSETDSEHIHLFVSTLILGTEEKKISLIVPYHKHVPIQAGLKPEFMPYVGQKKLIKTSPLGTWHELM